MDQTGTYFMYFVFVCLGIALGSFIQSRLERKPPPPPSDDSFNGPEDSVEILRAWRTTDGQLRLGMDKQQLANAEALTLEQRRRLTKLVADLSPWTDTAASPGSLPAQPPVTTGEAPSALSPQTTPLATPPAGPSTKATAAPGKTAEVRPTPGAIKSIIEQIDDVLQAKLAHTIYADKDIHLAEGPVGEVIVKIGLNKFDGIDAVPDPEVKALIRQAIADWEKGSK